MSGVSNVKSSVQKGIFAAINTQFPYIKDYLPDIIPKKDPLRVAKWYGVATEQAINYIK